VPGATTSYDLHQPTFDVDERAIGVGVRVLAATAITALWDDGAMVAQPLPGVTGALPTHQARHRLPPPGR
jgi:hypothetical protein